MNKLKLILASLCGVCIFSTAVASTQPSVSGSDSIDNYARDEQGVDTMDYLAMRPAEFQPTSFAYDPATRAFVVIDSFDCSIDYRIRVNATTELTGRYQTDSTYKRHDLVNILRPVSVTMFDRYIIFLATSAKDSSYVGVLQLNENMELELVKQVGLSCHSNSFRISPDGTELIVVGKNPLGYNINIFNISEGIENISAEQCESSGYRVKKQSEKIKESDPYGIGLMVVAVCVVFFALICIALILKGYGKSIINIQTKRANKAAAAQSASAHKVTAAETADTAGDVYAAIAAAIYLYDEELHDDEDGIITIQKVERAWTPWNAKFYNMNKYFNNNR